MIFWSLASSLIGAVLGVFLYAQFVSPVTEIYVEQTAKAHLAAESDFIMSPTTPKEYPRVQVAE